MIFKDFTSGSQIVSLEVFYLPPRNLISLKKNSKRGLMLVCISIFQTFYNSSTPVNEVYKYTHIRGVVSTVLFNFSEVLCLFALFLRGLENNTAV